MASKDDRIDELEAENAKLREELGQRYNSEGDALRAKDAEIADLKAELAGHRPEPHVPQPYPGMRYHADGRTLVVQNELDDDTAKAEGFVDAPVVQTTAFPSYRYRKGTTLSVVVNSQAEADALGDGWTADK